MRQISSVTKKKKKNRNRYVKAEPQRRLVYLSLSFVHFNDGENVSRRNDDDI